MIPFDAWTIAFFVVALVPAIILHELMHGVVANAFGDHTARDAGRLSLNPVRHIDPFGTILLPGMLLALSAAGAGSGVVFGYAKPVPVNARKLRNPRTHLLLVSLAGPATNLVLAALAAGVVQALRPVPPRAAEFFVVWILTNLVLFVFNMVPLPPLDGSEVIAWALPEGARRVYRSLSRYGFLLLLVVLVAFPTFLSRVVGPVVDAILRLLFR